MDSQHDGAAEREQRLQEALVAYAHAEGVIHRDLKPGNVLVDRDGEPRITDFGLAKRVEGDSGLTATGQVVGTPSYMPPEQARGELDKVGPRADVYAAGAVLYCLLTARPPFQAANPLDTLLQVLEKDPLPVRDLVPQVPRDLETICLKCLEKEPRGRYGSAGEFAADLQRFLNGEPVKARPISRPARVWRWCRRKPAVSSLLAVAALLLLSVAVVSSLGYVRVRRERNNANHQLYLAHMHLAHNAWQAAEITHVQQLLDEHGPQPGKQDLRGWEWYYLKALCQKDLLTLPYRGNDVAGHSRVVAWSPDGQKLAAASWGGTVEVRDASTGKELCTLRGDRGDVHAVAWSPDGQRLAAASGSFGQPGTVRIWPDGQRLATASRDGTVKLWNPATGQQVRSLYGDTAPLEYERNGAKVRGQGGTQWKYILSVAWSANGRFLAAGSRNGTVRIWDTGTGQEICTLRGHEGMAYSVAWSPDSRNLAVGSSNGHNLTGEVIVWNTSLRKRMFTLRGHARPVQAVAWSPDGQRLASGSDDQSIRVWDLPATQEALVLRSRNGGIRAVAWSPDGQKLAAASADGTVTLWNASVSYAGDKKTRQ
ncbi:MAG: protein kinase [Pirellulaceae bacterium]